MSPLTRVRSGIIGSVLAEADKLRALKYRYECENKILDTKIQAVTKEMGSLQLQINALNAKRKNYQETNNLSSMRNDLRGLQELINIYTGQKVSQSDIAKLDQKISEVCSKMKDC